jgi:hypothetical protein
MILVSVENKKPTDFGEVFCLGKTFKESKMSDHPNSSGLDIAMPLELVSLALVCCLGFTDFGQASTFWLVAGVIATLTAIVYIFQTSCEMTKFAPFGIAFYSIAALLDFTLAAWPVV